MAERSYVPCDACKYHISTPLWGHKIDQQSPCQSKIQQKETPCTKFAKIATILVDSFHTIALSRLYHEYILKKTKRPIYKHKNAKRLSKLCKKISANLSREEQQQDSYQQSWQEPNNMDTSFPDPATNPWHNMITIAAKQLNIRQRCLKAQVQAYARWASRKTYTLDHTALAEECYWYGLAEHLIHDKHTIEVLIYRENPEQGENDVDTARNLSTITTNTTVTTSSTSSTSSASSTISKWNRRNSSISLSSLLGSRRKGSGSMASLEEMEAIQEVIQGEQWKWFRTIDAGFIHGNWVMDFEISRTAEGNEDKAEMEGSMRHRRTSRE